MQNLVGDFKYTTRGKIISKNAAPIVICGLLLIKAIVSQSAVPCEIQTHYRDGDILPPGATLLTLIGPVDGLVKVERIILNFLQHLCAIATLTAKFVSAVSHTHTKILDTRKTLPGFRHLAKYAVRCGGGVNHRLGLYDAVMLKDTHIDSLGGMASALSALSFTTVSQFPVIVEVCTLQELEIVMEQGLSKISRVLLDNMPLALLGECVEVCRGRIPTEASGNISLDNVTATADSGVDFISVGKLTHSAGSVDLSMKCEG
jgi:nicotinate-nucleotide pyrophosphorylase (carboxylating)